MNILIPDSWLREFLKTKATPKQLKEYLSLCGPSVERIHTISGEPVYDVEITTNRPDCMSIAGVAREAACILPRFGIKAELIDHPYKQATRSFVTKYRKVGPKKLSITTDSKLNPRWSSIVLTNVQIRPSPKWLQEKLEKTGIRPVNNIVDITNYLMRTYGQPAHAFDYDEINPKNGIPTMILRASKKGEKLTTLDGKTHYLPGGDIVIEDGQSRLIDLCGIMGAANSAIKESTTNVVLFLQTYDPVTIRRTSMALAHRTEASSLFEKGIDSELVLPAIAQGVELAQELAGALVASRLYDIYPKPYKPRKVSVARGKVDAYLGTALADHDIVTILTPLGITPQVSKHEITVEVPSFRADMTIDVDIIEEIARIYGYHNINTRLPDTEPPIVSPAPDLTWEEEVKIRLRDWGFTEIYSYSMISENLIDKFDLGKSQTYKIANPLSTEWVYMRPTLLPSMLTVIEQNLHVRDELKFFELSMEYHTLTGGLPYEQPTLIIAWTGEQFYQAKGLAEAIFQLFGIEFPYSAKPADLPYYIKSKSLSLGIFGTMGLVDTGILSNMNIAKPITILYMRFDQLVKHSNPTRRFRPIPKYPPVIEDFSFVVPSELPVGNLMEVLQKADPLISDVRFLNAYQTTRTLRVSYLDPNRTLTDAEIKPIREKLIQTAQLLGATLKTS